MKKETTSKKSKPKKRFTLPNEAPKLTPSENDILHLLSEEYLTPKQIVLRRGCSKQYVYKVIRSLKKKGELTPNFKKVYKVQSSSKPKAPIRLHGEEFNIKIIWQDHKYQDMLSRCNLLYLDSNTIRLYKNSIEIYSGNSFTGKTAKECQTKSMSYWNKFFHRLENDLKVILVKPRKQNIKLVNSHYAYMDSEICKNTLENDDKNIQIRTTDDGKVWMITDQSLQGFEDETIHSKTSYEDRNKVDKYFNDLRDNNPPTNSEIYQILTQSLLQSKKAFEMIQDLVTTQKLLQENMQQMIKLTNIRIERLEKQ